MTVLVNIFIKIQVRLYKKSIRTSLEKMAGTHRSFFLGYKDAQQKLSPDTKFELIFERIIFYYIWGVLTWFMGSFNALLWSENVLKCVKCVEIFCQVIVIHNTLLLLPWTISIMQTRTAYQQWSTLMILLWHFFK